MSIPGILVKAISAVLLAGSAGTLLAVDAISQNPQRILYFGETHMHTAYSLDAFLGGTRIRLADDHQRGRSVEQCGAAAVQPIPPLPDWSGRLLPSPVARPMI